MKPPVSEGGRIDRLAALVSRRQGAETILRLMEDGDAIVGSTPRSRQHRANLRREIDALAAQIEMGG